MGTIVVGVDGSDAAARALDFAAEEAGIRKADLRVVCVWEVPVTAYGDGMIPVVTPDMFDSYQEHAKGIVDAAVARIREAHPGLSCTGDVVEGLPAGVLIDESETAELVVLGTRGRGGFKSLLLGSVSAQVVHHASCPVVVVPAEG